MEAINAVRVGDIYPAQEQKVSPKKINLGEMPNDSFQKKSSPLQFSENLTSKYHRTGLFKGYYTMQGNINDKKVSLELNKERTGLLSFKKNYTGNIGEQKVQVTVNKNTVTGAIDDKEVNLSYNKDFIGKGFSITGNIGDKEINIQRGTSVSEAEGDKDILTLCMSLCGKEIKTKNGQFDSLGLSRQAEIEVTEAMMYDIMFSQNQAMQQQQMMMQQQMMQQQMMQQQMMM